MLIEVSVVDVAEAQAETRILARRLHDAYIPDSSVRLQAARAGATDMGTATELTVTLGGPAGILAFARVVQAFMISRRKNLVIARRDGKGQRLLKCQWSGRAPGELQAIVSELERWREDES